MEAIGAKRMGLVAPYSAEVSDSVGDHFEASGIEVVKTLCMDFLETMRLLVYLTKQ